MLWGLFGALDLPKPVDAADITAWSEKHLAVADPHKKKANAKAMRKFINAEMEAHTSASKDTLKAVAEIKARAMLGHSQIEKAIARIDDNAFACLLESIGRLGLTKFAPNFASNDRNSDYNMVHERIALATFNTMAYSNAYPPEQVRYQAYFQDKKLLQKLYREYVFDYIGPKASAQERGEAESLQESTEIARARTSRKKVRSCFLRIQKLPQCHLAGGKPC